MRARSLGCLFALTALTSAGAQLRAGVASVSITPREPVWLAGDAARHGPGELASDDIRARALALDDASGGRAVLISVELLSVPRSITETVAAGIIKALSLDRGQILINATGTHNGPFVRDLQPELAPAGVQEQRQIADYSTWLTQALVDLARAAFANLQPSRISVGFGQASFAVHAPLRAESDSTSSASGIDTTIPVLRIASTDGHTLAAVFGYACRAATLGSGSHAISGDYPGIAAAQIEREIPGCVALFLRLCDGDQSPRPRGSLAAAASHGSALAREVLRVLRSPMKPVTGPLRAALTETSLAFSPYTRAELDAAGKSSDPVRVRWAERLLDETNVRGAMRSMPYEVQAIRFGKTFAIVALAGEPAAGYAAKIRNLTGLQHLIVAGGTNAAGYFVPEANASASDTGDAADSILYSGLPGPFTSEAEERILDAVTRVWKRALK